MSFFLAVPALTAAGILEAVTKSDGDRRTGSAGARPWSRSWSRFVVAYASIAWLLRYVAGHNFDIFVVYRIALGAAGPRPGRDGGYRRDLIREKKARGSGQGGAARGTRERISLGSQSGRRSITSRE